MTIKFNKIKLPSNRSFGFFFTAVFIVTGLYFFWINFIILSLIFFGLTVFFLITSLIKPDVFLPLNKLWMRLGLFIGKIVSPIILGIIFFALFTPIALITKLFGRDELCIKFKSQISYWKPRETNSSFLGDFKKQF